MRSCLFLASRHVHAPVRVQHSPPRGRTAARHASIAVRASHPTLSKAEKNNKRAESQRLGKKLVVVHLGKLGISQSFVQGLRDALSGNELVKVRP